MCLMLLGYKVSDKYPLVFAANRDEFYQRPTAPMHFWEDDPFILAGKDLEQGGTWLGLNQNGRFAALTNFRDPSALKADAPSRGGIIVDYFQSGSTPEDFLTGLEKQSDVYNGFNLIASDKESLFWFSNIKKTIQKIEPGIHGLSNRFLNSPWPKVQKGRAKLKKILCGDIKPELLFNVLKDPSIPADKRLPETGVGLAWERILSPLFIQSDIYGTRSSTILLMDRNRTIKVTERTYDPLDNTVFDDQSFSITT